MIDIIYEDDDLMAISKPSGMTVNKADTTADETTVQDWAEGKLDLTQKVDKTDSGYENDFVNRGGIVHRLDKETSGVLLIAKTPTSFLELQRQFRERVTKKTYLALAHGRVTPDFGEINAPVGRLPWNRKQFGVVAGGREALTKYTTLENFETRIMNQKEVLTLLELYPQTGRTHQIRVHLKYIGYPIFADFLYAGRKTQRFDRKILNRVFLHAAKITFNQPTTGKVLTIESRLPKDLQDTINKLKS